MKYSKKYLLVLIIFLNCSNLNSSENIKEIKNTINNNILKWYSNLCSSNIEQVVSLYSSKIIFFPTSSKILINGLKGVRNYFSQVNKKYKAFKTNKRIILNPEIRLIDNNTVLVTGIDKFEGVIDNENNDSFSIMGKQSLIFTKEDNEWKIIHHHRSRLSKRG